VHGQPSFARENEITRHDRPINKVTTAPRSSIVASGRMGDGGAGGRLTGRCNEGSNATNASRSSAPTRRPGPMTDAQRSFSHRDRARKPCEDLVNEEMIRAVSAMEFPALFARKPSMRGATSPGEPGDERFR
jgi:hypothetical protein